MIDKAVSRGKNPVGGNNTARAEDSYNKRKLTLLDFFPAKDFRMATWNLSSQRYGLQQDQDGPPC